MYTQSCFNRTFALILYLLSSLSLICVLVLFLQAANKISWNVVQCYSTYRKFATSIHLHNKVIYTWRKNCSFINCVGCRLSRVIVRSTIYSIFTFDWFQKIFLHYWTLWKIWYQAVNVFKMVVIQKKLTTFFLLKIDAFSLYRIEFQINRIKNNNYIQFVEDEQSKKSTNLIIRIEFLKLSKELFEIFWTAQRNIHI